MFTTSKQTFISFSKNFSHSNAMTRLQKNSDSELVNGNSPFSIFISFSNSLALNTLPCWVFSSLDIPSLLLGFFGWAVVLSQEGKSLGFNGIMLSTFCKLFRCNLKVVHSLFFSNLVLRRHLFNFHAHPIELLPVCLFVGLYFHQFCFGSCLELHISLLLHKRLAETLVFLTSFCFLSRLLLLSSSLHLP